MNPSIPITMNQLVGLNFRKAREQNMWTQDECAEKLSVYLNKTLPKASISAIERGADRDRRRIFDAQELLIFALVFELPLLWFLWPVPGYHVELLPDDTALIDVLTGFTNPTPIWAQRLTNSIRHDLAASFAGTLVNIDGLRNALLASVDALDAMQPRTSQ